MISQYVKQTSYGNGGNKKFGTLLVCGISGETGYFNNLQLLNVSGTSCLL